MALKFDFFPEELNKLNEEVGKHPDLGAILHGQVDKDVYVQIAEIASFCGVLLNDTYSPQDILNLCTMLTEILYRRRTGITIIH